MLTTVQLACIVMSQSGAPLANFDAQMSTGALLFPTLLLILCYKFDWKCVYFNVFLSDVALLIRYCLVTVCCDPRTQTVFYSIKVLSIGWDRE